MLEQNYDLLFLHREPCVNYEIRLTNSTLTYNTLTYLLHGAESFLRS